MSDCLRRPRRRGTASARTGAAVRIFRHGMRARPPVSRIMRADTVARRARSEQERQPERVALSADSVIHIRHCGEPLRAKKLIKETHGSLARGAHNGCIQWIKSGPIRHETRRSRPARSSQLARREMSDRAILNRAQMTAWVLIWTRRGGPLGFNLDFSIPPEVRLIYKFNSQFQRARRGF